MKHSIFTANLNAAITHVEAPIIPNLKVRYFEFIRSYFTRSLVWWLFRKTAVLPLTYAKLVKLLEPIYSEQGTSRRQQEERTYRLFLNYLKEVAGKLFI